MKKLLIEGLLVGGFAILTVCFGREAYTLAAASLDQEVVQQATATPQVLTIGMIEPTQMPPLTPTPRQATPEPTATPELAPAVDYDEGEHRCLARFRKSCVSDKATWVTQVVACEVVQNRTTQEGFPDTNRRVLLAPNEFDGYNSKATIRRVDAAIADCAMRSFAEALTGDFTHRYTPFTGVYLEFSEDLRYCKVYDKEWHVVCDTSQFE